MPYLSDDLTPEEKLGQLLSHAVAALDQQHALREYWRKAAWSLAYEAAEARGADRLDATLEAGKRIHGLAKARPSGPPHPPYDQPEFLLRRWRELASDATAVAAPGKTT